MSHESIYFDGRDVLWVPGLIWRAYTLVELEIASSALAATDASERSDLFVLDEVEMDRRRSTNAGVLHLRP